MGVFPARLDAIQELLGAAGEAAADHHSLETSAGAGVNFLLN